MAADAFDHTIRMHLAELQSKLAAEYRNVFDQLEAKIAALESENQLHQKHSMQASHGDGGQSVVACCGDAVLAKADQCNEGSVDLPVLLPSLVPGSLEGASARPAKLAERASVARSAFLAVPATHSICTPPDRCSGDEATSEDDIGDSRPEASAGSPCGQGGPASAKFRVLDIWERPRLRVSSRKVSQRHTLDRLSTASSTFLSNSTSESPDDADGADVSTQQWLESKLQRFMMPPSSLQYLSWELMGLILVAHDIIMIPLQIIGPQASAFSTVASWFIRLFWTLDVLVSFLTGYLSPQGLIELRPARVARQYVRTRLFFDLVIVGCDWVEALIAGLRGGDNAKALQMLGMLRAIRLVRLVRLIKSQKISEFIFEHIRSEGVKLIAYIISIMLVLLCLIHVIACVWYGIHGTTGMGAPHEDGENFTTRYIQAFHYILSLFAGEQFLEPQNLLERVFTIVVLVFAFVVSAAFVGSLTTAMTQLQIIASKRSTQFAALNRYLSDYGISRELAARVQRNARHALKEQKRHTPESSVELMTLISDPLRSEIHYEVYSPILTAHPFFHLYNYVNPAGVRHICHTAVSPVSLSRGDVIFSEFEVPVAPRMFFVVSGRLVYVRSLEGQQSVGARQWAGEAVLWTRWAHRGTLRALTESRLLALDAQRLANIMSTFPTCHGINYAIKFVEGLNQISCSSELTDLAEEEELARQMALSIFQELDRSLEVPYEWRTKRHSGLSVGSLVSTKRLSLGGSRRSSVTSVLPSSAD